MKKIICILSCAAALFSFTFHKTLPNSNDVFTVVIDAGHGGHDTGAKGVDELHEKDLVLAVSKQIEKIAKGNHVNYIFTRNDDQFIKLTSRSAFANSHKADLFISLHVSTGDNTDSGFDVYYPSEGEFVDQSREYSYVIAKNLQNQTKKLKFRQHKAATFHVLTNVNCPSLLLELGFLSNENDARHLTNPNFQDEIAQTIIAAINEISNK